MLSFDITDRNIRVIKGTESGGGKIKIQSSTDIKIEEGLISNGYIKDIAQMATIINSGLKQRNIKDKDAVISISSNLIVFRELYIPKDKATKLKTAVQLEMQRNVTVNDEQSIAYTVIGDVEKDGKTMTKVLANAVPKNVVECYRRVFSMLNIQLKSVSVSCNCISRVLLSDGNVSSKMPLFLVQIDPNFININVFEHGQLSFSRFASISPDDYDDKSDYVFQAVTENLYRMFQFQRSRSGENVSDVVFYGDTSEFIRLTNSLEQMDVKASLLKVPPMLSGYENLEFSLYANAIGAMYHRPKEDETSNLLTTDATMGQAADGGTKSAKAQKKDVTAGQVLGTLFGGLFAGAVVIGIAWAIISPVMTGMKQKEIKRIDAWIESVQPELAEIDKRIAMVEKLNTFKGKIDVAKTGVQSYPIFNTEAFVKILECSDGVTLNKFSFSEDGIINLEYTAESLSMPSIVAGRFVEQDFFDNVTYEGFSSGEEDEDDDGETGMLINDETEDTEETPLVVVDPVTGEETIIEAVESVAPLKFTIQLQVRGKLQNEAIKNGSEGGEN
ncbi:MAG: pilus assembly protein PilM [Oscillospiraceae bacterium]|nr:pilus assembly protein PilM [Oscillospiraceae bacterium]